MRQARSRPVQPAKKPEAAPFFLPTVPGLEARPVFSTAAERPGLGEGLEDTPARRANKADKNKGASERLVRGAGQPLSSWAPQCSLESEGTGWCAHADAIWQHRRATPAKSKAQVMPSQSM